MRGADGPAADEPAALLLTAPGQPAVSLEKERVLIIDSPFFRLQKTRHASHGARTLTHTHHGDRGQNRRGTRTQAPRPRWGLFTASPPKETRPLFSPVHPHPRSLRSFHSVESAGPSDPLVSVWGGARRLFPSSLKPPSPRPGRSCWWRRQRSWASRTGRRRGRGRSRTKVKRGSKEVRERSGARQPPRLRVDDAAAHKGRGLKKR